MNIECIICSKLSSDEINCPYCSIVFCSYECLESHFLSNHSNNNNKIIKRVYEKPKIGSIRNNKIFKTSMISSPYITHGFIAKNIIYDKKYSLKNFIPEIENGEILVIGTGSYGQVFAYRNRLDKKLYAIKHMEKDRLRKSLKTLNGIYEEINIQSKIFHKNIVRLLNVEENTTSFDLIMEYASEGSLFYYIRDKYYLSEKESFKFFSQIVNAVYLLHKNDLIHRDIKPENILLYENGVCKLCDFGWCVKLDGKQRKTFCGTTEYMSPEIVNKVEYSKEIDIWSLGVLLYEMVHGYSPFRPDKEDFNANDVIHNIKIHDLKFDINISPECKELICHLLDENVKNRYKIEDIFNSKFMKKYEKKKLFFPEESNNTLQDINNNLLQSKSNNTLKSINNNILHNINNNNLKNKNSNSLKNITNNNLTDTNNNSLKNKNINMKSSNNIINTNIREKKEYVVKNNSILEFPQKKLKNYQSQRMLSSYLKNISKNKSYNDNAKEIKPNKNNHNSNNFNLFSEKKFKNASENKTDTNKINLYNSASFRFNKNINNFSSSLFNSKNKLEKNSNLKNIINNNSIKEVKSINASLINNVNSTKDEENNKQFNLPSKINTNQNINKRKINIRNYYKAKKENSKNKNSNDTEFKLGNASFVSVKKLTNDKRHDIINNNYFNTYRENVPNNKKYEKITIINGTQQKSLSEKNIFGPKDNYKRKKKFSINTTMDNNIHSKEKFKKGDIANSLKLDKISNFIDNIDMFKNYKITSSIENNYNFNSHILNSENTINTPKNKIYINKNIPILNEIQFNNKLTNTYRKLSSNSIFNNNYNTFLNNNFDKAQINTNYIFNPKISITLPSNSSFSTKSKNRDKLSNHYKIIYIGKNMNNTNVKNLSKSQSFLEPSYFNFNNKNSENNLKLFKNLNIKRKKEETNNIINEYDTPRFNTEREIDKNINENISPIFKGSESNFLKNKKYIKINEISKYKNIKDKKQKLNIKVKPDKLKEKENLKYNSNEEGFINKINNSKIMDKEKSNIITLRKVNYKIKLNNIIEEEKKTKNNSKEKYNFDSFSERTVKNKTNDKNYKNLFSARIKSRSKSKQLDNSKTPKKYEDKVKIIPSKLLNNFSLEFNKLKTKVCK